MPAASFATQFGYFRLRSKARWFETLPAIKVTATKISASLTGTYAITYPNPRGIAVGLFGYFENQEIWLAHTASKTMYRFTAGQVNAINPQKDTTVLINGRDLNGLLTDQKVYNSWDQARGDFVLCDPTYGAIPTQYSGKITTWHAFTDDYDRFDYWNAARWGAQPACCTMGDTDVTITGDGASTLTVKAATAYTWKVIEFRAQASAAGNSLKFGFTSLDRTQYIQFSLNASNVTCQNSDGTPQSAATTDAITQANYNYYRIEWAAGLARFFVNGILEASSALNVPSAALYPFFESAASSNSLTIDYIKVIELLGIDDYLSKGTLMGDLISDICDAGSSTTDYNFWVDDDFDLHIQPAGATPSGFSYGFNSSIYTDPTQKIISVDLNNEAKDLYNYIRVQGGQVLQPSTATDNFVGNGAQTSWALGYLAQKPLSSVTVGGVAKTEGTDFTVNYGTQNTIITFAVAPAGSAAIVVTYYYYIPIIAIAQNTSAIAAGQPKKEYDQTNTNITTSQRAQNIAAALLAYYSDPRTVITVVITLDPRLQLGTTVNVDAPYYGIVDSKYEIIQIQQDMALGTWTTTLTLASTTINTSAEIIRTILQQLKQLQAQGDTTATALESTAISDSAGLHEGITGTIYLINDSFISEHPLNGQLGRGTTLDDFESGTASWSGTNCAISSDSVTYIVGAKSMKLIASASPFSASSTQALGDLSSYTGAASGAPVTGTVGCWVYCATTTDITSATLQIGSSSGNYSQVAGVKTYADAFNLQAGWNYFAFRLKNATTTGTPNWTAVAFANFTFASAGTPTINMDYFNIGTGDIIGNNGFGNRQTLYSTTVII